MNVCVLNFACGLVSGAHITWTMRQGLWVACVPTSGSQVHKMAEGLTRSSRYSAWYEQTCGLAVPFHAAFADEVRCATHTHPQLFSLANRRRLLCYTHLCYTHTHTRAYTRSALRDSFAARPALPKCLFFLIVFAGAE